MSNHPSLPRDSHSVAVRDAEELKEQARRLSYNGTHADGVLKHRLFEIAGRIATGYYQQSLNPMACVTEDTAGAYLEARLWEFIDIAAAFPKASADSRTWPHVLVYAPKAQAPTGIEAKVCEDIAKRQQLGIAKYGTTVAGNPLPLRDWLQHAYEECLDQAVYLRRAIAEIDQRKDDGR